MWDANATGEFAFEDAYIKSVTYMNGTHSFTDPIVGWLSLIQEITSVGILVLMKALECNLGHACQSAVALEVASNA